MRLPEKPRVICFSDPSFGSGQYPYAFGSVPHKLEALCEQVVHLNPENITLAAFRAATETLRPDLIFGYMQTLPQQKKVAALLAEFHPAPAINWSLEDPNFVVSSADTFTMIDVSQSYDFWFCNDAKMVPFWRTRAMFVPPGFDEDIFFDAGLDRLYDVSYIGQLGSKNTALMYWPYLREIARYGKKSLFGTDRLVSFPLLPQRIEKFIRASRPRAFLQKLPLWENTWKNPRDEHEKALFVNQSRIHVGLNRVRGRWEPALLQRIPDYPLDEHRLFYQIKGRLFHAVGAGALALNEYCPELDDMFDIDREIVTFRFGDIEEFSDKLAWYSSHEDERARIAKAGYARGRRQHTWTCRIRQIFDAIRAAT